MDPVLGEFEQVVLFAIVRLDDAAYGATIRREIEARTGRQVSIGAIYTTLDRLENKGLVRSWVGEPTPERGGRRRKYFGLEAAGARALRAAYDAFGAMTAGLEHRLRTL